MSDEPKKLIETHLEALAAHRRQSAGGVFEMDEATRRTLLDVVQSVHGLIETPSSADAEAFVPFIPMAIEPAPEPLAATGGHEAEALRLALQAEVQRVDEPVKTAAPEEAEGPSAWRMLWMRLAFSFGTVAVIGLAAFIIRLQIPPERDGQSFAKLSQAASDRTVALKPDAEVTRSNLLADSSMATDSALRLEEARPLSRALAVNDAPRPMPAMAPARRSLSAPESAPAAAEKMLTSADRTGKAKDIVAAPASAPVLPLASAAPSPEPATKKIVPAESKLTEVRQMAEPAKAERPNTPPKPVGAASAPVPRAATAGTVGGAAAPTELSEGAFTQRAVAAGMRRNFQSPPRPDVLTTFRLVPLGDTVRLIDQDGSVYLGKRTSSGSPLRFSAAGNNVTLGQPVTVEATLVPGADGSAAVLRGQVNVGARRSWQFEAEAR